ncbi:hypothetical protein D3C83_50500 [compost metagenome]
MPVCEDGARTWIDDAANDVDQRRLARAVGSEQGENLALADLEIDAGQGDQSAGVGLGQARYGND